MRLLLLGRTILAITDPLELSRRSSMKSAGWSKRTGLILIEPAGWVRPSCNTTTTSRINGRRTIIEAPANPSVKRVHET